MTTSHVSVAAEFALTWELDATSHMGSGPEVSQEEASRRQSEALAFLVGSQRIASPLAYDRETNGGIQKILRKNFLFCRILGPIPDVLYPGDHSGVVHDCLYGWQAPGSRGLRPATRRTAAKAASLLRAYDWLGP